MPCGLSFRRSIRQRPLCSWCASWHLQNIFNWPLEKYSLERDQEIGPERKRSFADIKKSSIECFLCQIVYFRLRSFENVTALESSAPVSFIRECRCNRDSTTYRIAHHNGLRLQQGMRVNLHLKPGALQHTWLDIHRIRVWIPETPVEFWIHRFPALENEESNSEIKLLMGRYMKAETDTSLLNNWLNICRETHAGCQPSEFPSNVACPVWMIDVRQRKLVDIVETGQRQIPTYAALSYVWGSPDVPQLKNTGGEELRKRLWSFDGLSAKWEDIPTSIQDVMSVCELLSIGYLWVDSLCIRQGDDAPHLTTQLDSMATIYGCADLTIVATGESSWAGLPGIRPGSRQIHQKTCFVDGMMLGTSQAPSSKLGGSIWRTRAWTFQEEAISKRLLVFTEDEIFFLCEGCKLWRESMHLEPLFETAIATMGSNPTKLSLSNAESGEYRAMPGIEAFGDLLAVYASREMTYQSDALRAFQGIISVLSSMMDSEFFHGHPLKYFDCTLLFYITEFSPKYRRSQFPSWSWTGWNIKDVWSYDFSIISYDRVQTDVVCYRLDTENFLRSENKQPIFSPIGETRIPSSHKASSTFVPDHITSPFPWSWNGPLENMLIFDADSLHLRVTLVGSVPDYAVNPESYMGAPEYLVENKDVMNQSGIQDGICLDQKWRESQPHELEFIAIGRMERTEYCEGSVFALLVESDTEGISYRVQLHAFDAKGWDRAKPRRRRVYLC